MARKRQPTSGIRLQSITLGAVGLALVAATFGFIGAAPAVTGSDLQAPAGADARPQATLTPREVQPEPTAALTATIPSAVQPSAGLPISPELPLGGVRTSRPASEPTATPQATAAAATPAVRRRLAAFLGDSYTTGWVGAGIGRAGWPSIVARTFGWKSRNRAVAGTGFVNPGWTSQPMRTQVAEIIRMRPGIVFVAGGHNDRRYATRRSAAAADAVLERLRRGLPHATLVVIGPIWQDGRPAASIIALRDHLRRKARSMGAIFIDPLREGWFTGRAHRYIGSDGIHPTNAGHRYIAARVIANLQRHGGSTDLP